MSAKKTGGTAGRNRVKNSAMAAELARRGVKRTTFRDPVTYAIRPIGAVPGFHFGKK